MYKYNVNCNNVIKQRLLVGSRCNVQVIPNNQYTFSTLLTVKLNELSLVETSL